MLQSMDSTAFYPTVVPVLSRPHFQISRSFPLCIWQPSLPSSLVARRDLAIYQVPLYVYPYKRAFRVLTIVEIKAGRGGTWLASNI